MFESGAILEWLLERHGRGPLAPSLDRHPKLRAYFARLSARPAYERATA
jgi:glutathione S-transferase